MFSKLYNKLPVINFFISSSGLLFQISALYPWHNKLDDKFKKLEDCIKDSIKK
jgi:hypothetical protein